MEMDPKYAPIRVDNTNEEEDVTIWPVRIIIRNVGDGFPITAEDDERIRGAGGRITGTIDLLGPAEFEDCLGDSGGKHIDLDSTDIALRIREDNSVPITCNVRIDKDEWNNRPIDSIKLDFQLFYRYYVGKTASVTVVGR
jgi:hypothetical protein